LSFGSFDQKDAPLRSLCFRLFFGLPSICRQTLVRVKLVSSTRQTS
jgi:hypothetical protein